MPKISCIMILNNHIVAQTELACRSTKESVLSDADNFSSCNNLPTANDIDGSYLVYDNKRKTFIRSGAAAVGMKKRWKEHSSASLLKNHHERTNKFYCAYPSTTNVIGHSQVMIYKKGNFEQLEQFIGVGFKKELMEYIVNWFNWSEYEVEQLGLLAGVGGMDSIEEKKYRHLCYLFENAYALSLNQDNNISTNPGFEWQLGYYGK